MKIQMRTDWTSFAMIRKFLAKGLNTVKMHSTVYLHLDHVELSLIKVSRAANAMLILFLNCESSKFSGSPARSWKSKDPQFPWRILMDCSRKAAASLYLAFALRLSPASVSTTWETGFGSWSFWVDMSSGVGDRMFSRLLKMERNLRLVMLSWQAQRPIDICYTETSS